MKVKKVLFASLAPLLFAIPSVQAEQSLLSINKPTKFEISESGNLLSISIPELKTGCSYSFLPKTGEATEDRGIIDCPGKFPAFSKTIPLKTNSFIKQVRIGVHPDKLRLVLDLLTPLNRPLQANYDRNVFSFEVKNSFVSKKSPDSKPEKVEPEIKKPVEPIALIEPFKEIQKVSTKPLPPVIRATKVTLLESVKSPDNSVTVTASHELPISVESLQLNFNEGERLIRDLVVSNDGDSQFSVNVDCYPDHDQQEASINKAELSSEILLPSPRKFTLGPNQKRAIRFILNLGKSIDTNKELGFIVRLSDNEGLQLAPKVNISYLPKASLPDLVSTPQNGKLKLTNSGTARVELSSGRCCRGDECEAVALSNLAAGKSVILDLPEDCQLEFVREFKGTFQKFKVRKEILNDAAL